jgi:hypothetical protein
MLSGVAKQAMQTVALDAFNLRARLARSPFQGQRADAKSERMPEAHIEFPADNCSGSYLS